MAAPSKSAASSDNGALVGHLFRTASGQMVATLTRILGPGHLDLVEELVQDALVKALQIWPHAGVPDNPAGWLFQVARYGAIDALRRERTFRDKSEAIRAELTRAAIGAEPDTEIPALKDDELRLLFLCCRPELSRDARVALCLKLVGGFGVGEIARAFLTGETTIAQRIVRAKRTLRDAGLDLPLADARGRVDAVLEAVYLMFNEGYAVHAGDALIRMDLCAEALRLGRLVAAEPPMATPRAHALVALMAFQAARLPARTDAAGDPILLDDQDRTRWDDRLIALGFRHFDQASEETEISSYHLQAAIASAHARASDAESTDWAFILDAYDELLAIQPSPVVALNRVVALARVQGPSAALEALGCIETDPVLARYYLLHATRADLLARLGRDADAADALERALECGCSEPERRLLQRRLAGI